jgi:hypothetical protein
MGRNELLTQYPELAEELEEEIKRMEAENKAKQAELNEIQQKVSGVLENTKGAPSEGAAFVTKTQSTSTGESNGSSNVKPGSSTTTTDAATNPDGDDDDDLIISEETPITDDTREDSLVNDDNPEDLLEDSMDATSTKTTDLDSPVDASTQKEDFALVHLAVETLRAFVKHAKDDVNRIIELVAPVLKPILTAGDVAWRQLKALFLKAREAYETYEASSNDGGSNSQAQEASTEHQETENA